VCGRGYIKTVSLHQGTNQSQVRDKRNLAVEFDSTGFKISDLPASSNYWQPGNHRFLTADLIGLNQMDEYKNDSLYKGILQTVNNAQGMRLPVVMYHDEPDTQTTCRRYIAEWKVKVCTSEADCNS
jgi:hypothetical protein